KNLKLTSLARDTLVNIPGHGYEKLTHAYAYGKSKLLLDTIEKNLNIDLDGYVAVNFNSFIDLVDTLGGVEVNVHKNEIEHLNDIIVNSFKVAKDKGEEPQF
ncbi:LCP family protein, partial [Casaltella massiliensis]|nr:LCP family protein [Casaltella massiliensis]